MEATAADAMGDVMTTSATILSLLALKYLNWNIDGIVGLAVSVAVMYGGLNIAKDTLAPLIGEAIEPEVYEEISNFVEGYEGILGTHDLIVHNYGPSTVWHPSTRKFQATTTRSIPMRSLTGSKGMLQKI